MYFDDGKIIELTTLLQQYQGMIKNKKILLSNKFKKGRANAPKDSSQIFRATFSCFTPLQRRTIISLETNPFICFIKNTQ